MSGGRPRPILVAIPLFALVAAAWLWFGPGDGGDAQSEGTASGAATGTDFAPASPPGRAPAPAVNAAESAGDAADLVGDAADPRSAAGRTEVADPGFRVRGRLVFPDGVPVPEGSAVHAVRRRPGNARLDSAALAAALRTGAPQPAAVAEDGRFSLLLPGPDPLAHSWHLVAGAPGWARAVTFPDPRPQSPPPEAEVVLEMHALLGAVLRLVGKDGGRPAVSRDLLRDSGGSGLAHFGGWSMEYPLDPERWPLLVGLPDGLPPVVGGQDPARGWGRPELAVFQAAPESHRDGQSFRFQLALEGYRPVDRSVLATHLAGPPAEHTIVLEALAPTGALLLRFDRADWWRRELAPHGLAGLSVSLKSFDPQRAAAAPGGPDSLEKTGGPWRQRLAAPPADGLLLEGIPEGHYWPTLVSDDGMEIPLQPGEVRIAAGALAQATADLGPYGLIALRPAEGWEGDWSRGRFVAMVPGDGALRRFTLHDWPALLGPLPVGEQVVLLRALDQDDRTPRLADRLDHSDEFPVVAGARTDYLLQGVR